MTFTTLDDKLSPMMRIAWVALLLVLLPSVAQKSGAQTQPDPGPFAQKRSELLAKIASAEKLSKTLQQAFEGVPREQFLPSYLSGMAYQDSSLPLGKGQTLPSPSDLLRAVQALDVAENDTVLVFGAGSSYLTALLSRMASKIFDIELLPAERANARRLFAALGFSNIVVSGNGSPDGFTSDGPFDRIFVHGATTSVPSTIFDELRSPGKMVVPLRDPTGFQMVVVLSRSSNGVSVEALGKGFYSPIEIGSGSGLQ